MFLTLILLASCSLAERFIVVKEKSILNVQDSFKKFGSGIEMETITIGNFQFHITENPFQFDQVLHIEKEQIFSVVSQYNTQENPIWNLDRADQRDTVLDNKYYYHSSAGKGVYNYVIDTGIDISHPEFEGRAVWGANFADNEGSSGCIHPHGTHVAGTIGSKTYGIAKKTNLVAVKVLDCNGSGSTSNVLKGISFVMQQKNNKNVSSVINMSLGGPFSHALNVAVKQATDNGIHVISAAGNENSDACKTSPASEKTAITVGAFGHGDTIAYFSNWGHCVDVFAPGVSILSTIPENQTDIYDGTSCASPLVAGIVSLVLSEYNEGAVSTKHMKKILIAASTKGLLKGKLHGSPNNIVFSLI